MDSEKNLEIEPPPGPISLLEKRNLKKKNVTQEQEERVKQEGERRVAMEVSAGQRAIKAPQGQDSHTHASESETHSHAWPSSQQAGVLRVITGKMPLRDAGVC